MGASAVKTWLRLGHSVKCCNASLQQHCTGSLGQTEALCQGNAKLLWWFIHLAWLCWGVQIFRLLMNSTHLHDPVCYWVLETSPLLTPECCTATECFLYSSASSGVPEYAARLENFPGERYWGYLEAAMQKCCVPWPLHEMQSGWLYCHGNMSAERERTLSLTSNASSSIHSWLWKKMFGLSAWEKIDHESVAEDSVPWVPEGVIPKSDLVLPWTSPAVEEYHWKGRNAEQDLSIVNNQ